VLPAADVPTNGSASPAGSPAAETGVTPAGPVPGAATEVTEDVQAAALATAHTTAAMDRERRR
jgi:hypothetical protein